MKGLICTLLLAVAGAGFADAQHRAEHPKVFLIQRPTIVAFFPPVTQDDLGDDGDTAEALSDFQYYAGSVRNRVQNTGIDFEEADGISFRISIGNVVQTFHPGKIGVGYYLIAPGKNPLIKLGVMTDEDLVKTARKYFGIAIPKEKCTVPHCSK